MKEAGGRSRGLAFRAPLLASSIAAAVLALGVGGVRRAAALEADRVVVIVVDGPRDSEFLEHPSHAYIPRIWNTLRPQGYISHTFYNTGTTTTISGHATIASGTAQDLPDDGSVRPNRPLLWEYLRDQTAAPDSGSVLIALKGKLACLSYSTFPGYGPPDSTCVIAPTWNDAISVQRFFTFASTHHPRLSLLAFGEPDGRAHAGDWAGYLHSIERADSLTAAVWNWIQSTPGYANRTELFLTADHGRHTTDWMNHGDGCAGCRHLPLLALGPDIRAGIEAWGPAGTQSDIVATAALALGIVPYEATGRVLEELFVNASGAPDPAPPRLILEVAPSPAKDRVVLRVPERTRMPDSDRLGAVLYDATGRRLWAGEVSSGALRAGFTLRRPERWTGSGISWIVLRPPGGASPAITAPICWVR